MRRVVSRKPIHAVVLPLVLYLLLAATAARAAEKSMKLYSPLDEPKPPIPKEMLSDERLDQHVKVFVKGKNLKEILDELSAKTGVKLVVERETRFERPIIYFHSRPLRDVLTEVSGLYGYHWLVKGEKGAYRYELFEDLKHAQRRGSLAGERQWRLDSLLLDFAEEFLSASSDDERLKRLQQMNPKAYEQMAGDSGTIALYRALGGDLLRRSLVDGSVTSQFTELPPGLQTEVCNYMNGMFASRIGTRDPSGFSSASLVVKRIGGGTYGLPRFDCSLVTSEGTFTAQWPSHELTISDCCSFAGWRMPQTVIAAEQVADETKISTETPKGRQGPLLGDILEAVAKQSGKDVIADYYFQHPPQQPVSGVPLKQFVENLCRSLNYTCQVEGSLLRFRFDDWFLLPLMEEPPGSLLNGCWDDLERTGRIGQANLVGLASLPERQRSWPGLRFIPLTNQALRDPEAIRFWGSLSQQQMTAARSENGLAVSDLSQSQQQLLAGVIGRRQKTVSPDKMATGVITIADEQGAVSYGQGKTAEFQFPSVTLKSGSESLLRQSIASWPPLDDETRERLVAQRKADREADVIEVLD